MPASLCLCPLLTHHRRKLHHQVAPHLLSSRLSSPHDRPAPSLLQNLQARSGQVGFVRLPVDEFVVDLAVRCPGVRFRDVVDLAAAGEHVLAVSKAIAREPYKANVSRVFF